MCLLQMLNESSQAEVVGGAVAAVVDAYNLHGLSLVGCMLVMDMCIGWS